jgi:hypothetical protein
VPIFAVEYVFVDPEIADPARAEVSRFREELDAARTAKKAFEKQGEKQ